MLLLLRLSSQDQSRVKITACWQVRHTPEKRRGKTVTCSHVHITGTRVIAVSHKNPEAGKVQR